MSELISTHAGALAIVFAALLVGGVLAFRTESLSLWLLSTWHSLPWIGGIAALARRQRARRSGSESAAVMALCSSYGRYIRVLSRADYDNYMSYLRKAGDLGREPFPAYLRVVIFSMVLIEAAGLAYVLAGWTLPGASEFAQRVAALGIGFLIAVVLVFFTHWAGLEIDQVSRYRRDYDEWVTAGKPGPLYGPDLSLNDNQSVDDREPAFRQRATRGHGKTTYVLTTITLLMVLAVGSGAAFVRGQVLEQEIVNESNTRARTLQRFDMGLPDKGAADTAQFDPRSMQDEIAIKRRGGWGTLIILGIIFFFLQILSIFFGYRHSFNGRLSKEAYRALRIDSFSSYNELTQYYDRVADLAQGKLERLQQLLEHHHRDDLAATPGASRYSFRDYLQARDVQRRDKPLGAEPDATSPDRPLAAQTPAATPLPATASASVDIAPATPAPAELAAAPPGAAAAPAPIAVPVPLVAEVKAQEPVAATVPVVPIFGSIPLPLAVTVVAEEGETAESVQARLDLAERLERDRAAARGTRSKANGRAKKSVLKPAWEEGESR